MYQIEVPTYLIGCTRQHRTLPLQLLRLTGRRRSPVHPSRLPGARGPRAGCSCQRRPSRSCTSSSRASRTSSSASPRCGAAPGRQLACVPAGALRRGGVLTNTHGHGGAVSIVGPAAVVALCKAAAARPLPAAMNLYTRGTGAGPEPGRRGQPLCGGGKGHGSGGRRRGGAWRGGGGRTCRQGCERAKGERAAA